MILLILLLPPVYNFFIAIIKKKPFLHINQLFTPSTLFLHIGVRQRVGSGVEETEKKNII